MRRRNLAELPWAEVRRGRVSAALIGQALDLDARPGRARSAPVRGRAPTVIAALLRSGPRAIAYVACDPASLARDVRSAHRPGWRLRGLRAFDAFPMTHHVECIALLTPN